MTTGALVLPATAPRDRWLAARRSGITATDVVKIVGLSKYGNALDSYLDKRLGEEDREPSEAAAWGLLLEDPVARRWAAQRGCRVRRVGLMRHRVHSHHMASIDRVVVGERAPLECKTRNVFADDFADSVPERVVVQVQWQMHVSGAEHAYVAALIGGQELVTHTVRRDQVLIDYLRSEADRVWGAVLAGEPPDVPAWQQTAAALDRLYPDRAGVVDVDPDAAGPLIADYHAASASESAAKAAKAAAKVALLDLLGDHEEARVGGVKAWTYRATSQTGIPADNLRALIEAHPDIAEQYVTTTASRRLVVARPKED